jgi:hypothetical protein
MDEGINIKYNYKKPNYMLSPYGGFHYLIKSFEFSFRKPTTASEADSENIFINKFTSTFPEFSWVAGVQIAFRASANSAFFVNVGYQQFIGNVETLIHEAKSNKEDEQYKPINDGKPYKYGHFTISIGFGFKYGLFDRKK